MVGSSSNPSLLKELCFVSVGGYYSYGLPVMESYIANPESPSVTGDQCTCEKIFSNSNVSISCNFFQFLIGVVLLNVSPNVLQIADVLTLIGNAGGYHAYSSKSYSALFMSTFHPSEYSSNSATWKKAFEPVCGDIPFCLLYSAFVFSEQNYALSTYYYQVRFSH